MTPSPFLETTFPKPLKYCVPKWMLPKWRCFCVWMKIALRKIAVHDLFISPNHFRAKCSLKGKKKPELSIVWAQLFLAVVVNSPQRLAVRSIAAVSIFCQDSLSFTASPRIPLNSSSLCLPTLLPSFCLSLLFKTGNLIYQFYLPSKKGCVCIFR